MKDRSWTFETLAQADSTTLERVLLESTAPDPQQLTGSIYDGFNHDWLGQLSGTKFRKAFLIKEGEYYGLNQFVQQDNKDVSGQWLTRVEDGRPVEKAFFRILPASEGISSGQVGRYSHLLCFDYNVDLNPSTERLMRSIRDYVGLPNAGDHGLLLGKAYLQIAPFLRIFASYFILGRRKPYERS